MPISRRSSKRWSPRKAIKKALEAEVDSSKTRDLALRSSREAEEANARELAELRADYDQLSEVGVVEEARLESWLGDRPQLSYEASDFELPVELEIDSLLAFSGERTDDDADRTQGEADEDWVEDEVAEDEAVEDEVAEDATLVEGGEAVRRDE
ncbi:unnamed protein product [Cochlearia groenlandica]